MTQTVLLAEDELALAHIVRESLEERGYRVVLCPNGEVALRQYERSCPDILVLDIMMPVLDGFAVARQVRKTNKHLPIIFLTARSQGSEVVAGFEAGANDYLKKPFSLEELIVRIKVQLTKGPLPSPAIAQPSEIYQLGEFEFHARKNMICHATTIKQVTSRESELLKLLCQNGQQVTERTLLLKKIWGSDTFFTARSLDVFISKLRRHLAADPAVQIITIRGVGYRLVHD